VITPFSDDRGPEYARSFPTSRVPLVSLLHRGGQLSYPDHAGALSTHVDHHTVVAIGGLETALPGLLADTMRRMALADAQAAPEQPPDAPPADFLVSGRLKRTAYRHHASVLAGATLGILGVPCFYASYELEFEVYLYRASDPLRPILQKTYRFIDSQVGGLYYNRPSVTRMFVRGLEQTLPEVGRDLASAARDEARDYGLSAVPLRAARDPVRSIRIAPASEDEDVVETVPARAAAHLVQHS
jgi:hypothetical protein